MPDQLELPFGDVSALVKAERLITGQRKSDYGETMPALAKAWSAYLLGTGGRDLTAKDVCYMLTLLKLVRLSNNPRHEDSLVDGIGYLALAEKQA